MKVTQDSGEDKDLDKPLMLAIIAGRDAGGQADKDGNHLPGISAILWVYAKNSAEEIDLRVDFNIAAVAKLRGLLTHLKPLNQYYRSVFENPQKYIEESR
jgi:hypothetical protein